MIIFTAILHPILQPQYWFGPNIAPIASRASRDAWADRVVYNVVVERQHGKEFPEEVEASEVRSVLLAEPYLATSNPSLEIIATHCYCLCLCYHWYLCFPCFFNTEKGKTEKMMVRGKLHPSYFFKHAKRYEIAYIFAFCIKKMQYGPQYRYCNRF